MNEDGLSSLLDVAELLGVRGLKSDRRPEANKGGLILYTLHSKHTLHSAVSDSVYTVHNMILFGRSQKMMYLSAV